MECQKPSFDRGFKPLKHHTEIPNSEIFSILLSSAVLCCLRKDAIDATWEWGKANKQPSSITSIPIMGVCFNVAQITHGMKTHTRPHGILNHIKLIPMTCTNYRGIKFISYITKLWERLESNGAKTYTEDQDISKPIWFYAREVNYGNYLPI